MRKRAGLARALVLEPKVLLADEPSSGLDRITASEIDELLLRQKRDKGMTILVVTHDVHGARRVGDRFAVLDKGDLIAYGTAAEVESSGLDIARKLKNGGLPGVNRPLIVGVLVISGLGLFITGLFMIGNRHEAFARHVELYAEFSNLSGITQGAKVQVAGMDAGQVQGVEIPDAPPAKFRVKVRVTEKLRGLVRTDSVVTIGTEGVVGNRFLAISPGTARATVAAPGATLAGIEPTDISALLDQAKGAIGNIDTTVLNANQLMTNANGLITTLGGNLNSTVTEVRTTVSNANELIAGIKKGAELAGCCCVTRHSRIR